MQDEKFLMLQTHQVSKGMPDEMIKEISDHCEVIRFKSGEVIHSPEDVITSVEFVIAGRLKLEMIDLAGRTTLERYVARGNQYGALSAATTEPTSVRCTAQDPTIILRLDYETGLDLTRKHDLFRRNMMRLLATTVQQTLLNTKAAKPPGFVAIIHESPETRCVSRKLFERLVELGEEPRVLSDQEDWEPIDGVRHLHVYIDGGKGIDEDKLRRQIREWSDCPRIITDVNSDLHITRASRMLTGCDRILWCVTPDNWQNSLPKLKSLQKEAPGWKDKVCIVWLLGKHKVAPLSPELNALASRNIKISFDPPEEHQGQALVKGFDRLVHLMRGIQIGVALGGGAARGMAHLGVLKALEEAGITVDMIAGTSAGAMTGTIYASGMEIDYAIDRFVNDLRPSWFFRCLPRGDQWYLLYKYRRRQFDPMLRKYLKEAQLEQLPIPMNSITVDLVSGKVVVRDIGDAVQGIVESINLPVLSSPIIRPGQALVDGGMINNVPADVLVSKGCNFVIAVSVTAQMETEFVSNRPDTPAEQMKSPSTLQTILRTYLVQSASVNSLGVQPADIVIEPDVTQFELTDFVKTDQLAEAGLEATSKLLPEIKSELARLDPGLFKE